MSFFKKYVLHHFWLGFCMIIEALFLFWKAILIWASIYLVFGIFFLIDDILAETRNISVMKRLPSSIQQENLLKLLGIFIFLGQFAWFLYLYLTS